LSIFVDTSVWFAAASKRDHSNERAKAILRGTLDHVTSNHVLVETWQLLNSRYGRHIAERFLEELQHGGVRIEMVTLADLRAALAIAATFPDQSFSIVDRTSFAVIERLGIGQVASFDSDFAIYRYGRRRERAFEIVQSGRSEAFEIFWRAILDRHQLVLVYQGLERQVCPHILGHKDGKERALVYQFGGRSSGKLPRHGEWKCLDLGEVQNPQPRQGKWHSGDRHRARQRCIDAVFVDVNTAVPNQPGRR
jgi:uncharacterized protein